jgi:hypothetical protein
MLWREMLMGWLAVARGLGNLSGAASLVAFSAMVSFQLLTRQ